MATCLSQQWLVPQVAEPAIGPATCRCGCTAYWQDASGRMHCEACSPPSPRDRVVQCFVLEGDKLIDIVKQTAARRRRRPIGRLRWCANCFQRPETWDETTDHYGNRVRVVCRVCGRFIGYRVMSHEP